MKSELRFFTQGATEAKKWNTPRVIGEAAAKMKQKTNSLFKVSRLRTAATALALSLSHPTLAQDAPKSPPPPTQKPELDAKIEPKETLEAKEESTPPARLKTEQTVPEQKKRQLAEPKVATARPAGPPREESSVPVGQQQKNISGRKRKTRAEDILIWIPRAPLYPVYLTLNYLVRWPLVTGLTQLEKHHVFERTEDFFTFSDGKAALYPLAFYDAGRGFWGGAGFYYNDLGIDGHRLSATAGYGTNRWVYGTIKDTWTLFEDDRGTFFYSMSYLRDPTFALTGIGPDTSIDDEVFFSERKLELRANLAIDLENFNRFDLDFRLREARLGGGRQLSIESSDSPLSTEDYTGFDQAFILGSLELGLTLDSRTSPDPRYPGSGVKLETRGSYHYGPGTTLLSFFRYSLAPRAIWDITGAGHTLSAGIYAEALSRVGGEALPPNELIALGGNEHLRGFIKGRFRGDSTLVYDLLYKWPLLNVADAFVFAETGNVFDEFYKDFSHEKMALSWGTGLKTSFSPDIAFSLAIGFGSNQFDQMGDGFQLDNTRFFAGASHAY